jgi:hypothetical protein
MTCETQSGDATNCSCSPNTATNSNKCAAGRASSGVELERESDAAEADEYVTLGLGEGAVYG